MTYDASPQPRFCFLGCRGRIEKRHNCRQVAPARCVAPSAGSAAAAPAPALKAAADSAVRPASVARVLAAPRKAVSSGSSQAIGGRALLASRRASSSLPRAGGGTPYPPLAVTSPEAPRPAPPLFHRNSVDGNKMCRPLPTVAATRTRSRLAAAVLAPAVALSIRRGVGEVKEIGRAHV